MIGLGSNRLTSCRRGGMSVTQAGRGGMEWLGVRDPIWASPYSAQATAALKAQFPTQWPTIRDYGFAHPEDVHWINEYPYFAPYFLEGTLSYYLNGSDDLVNGKWADRIDPTILWTLNGSCAKSGDGFIINNGSAYMTHTSTGTDYNLHNHFIVFAEFTPDEDGFIMDWGSITSTSKNISFGKAKNGVANMNWKMQGNDSNPGCSVTAPNMTTEKHVFTWEIRDAGNGKDLFRYSMDYVNYDTAGIVPKATNFNGYTNWSNKSFYIGRGVAGASYSNMKGIIHKIAIFVID